MTTKPAVLNVTITLPEGTSADEIASSLEEIATALRLSYDEPKRLDQHGGLSGAAFLNYGSMRAGRWVLTPAKEWDAADGWTNVGHLTSEPDQS